jgi:cell wall-associated NlpC family hydrolase
VQPRWSVRRIVSIRSAAVAVSLGTAAAVVAVSGPAGAAPPPTKTQVQQRLSHLITQSDRLGQQYDQVLQELATASQRLRLINAEAARYQRAFQSMRAEIGRIAAVVYEQGGFSSSVSLIASGSPQQILSKSSILTELSSANRAQLSQYLAASRQVVTAQRAARQTEAGIAALRSGLAERRAKLIATQRALLAQLTPKQQSGLGPGGPSSGGSYTGPTSTQAQKAVAFAYAQIGKPYQWGATGPGSYDCSGLTSASWAAAGVSIPRTSYEQWAGLPHVSTSALQPGDILVMSGASHVGLYVGHGYLIDAPQTGQNVEKVALAGWYLSGLIGAVRP